MATFAKLLSPRCDLRISFIKQFIADIIDVHRVLDSLRLLEWCISIDGLGKNALVFQYWAAGGREILTKWLV